jgi:hypothetical protein
MQHACMLLTGAGMIAASRTLDRERAMKKFIFAAILVSAVISGAVAFTKPSDQPAKMDAGAGIDLSRMMASAKDLPVAYYKDYSFVFN